MYLYFIAPLTLGILSSLSVDHFARKYLVDPKLGSQKEEVRDGLVAMILSLGFCGSCVPLASAYEMPYHPMLWGLIALLFLMALTGTTTIKNNDRKPITFKDLETEDM